MGLSKQEHINYLLLKQAEENEELDYYYRQLYFKGLTKIKQHDK